MSHTRLPRPGFTLAALSTLAALGLAALPAAAQNGTLVMTSDPGDYIGQGQSYNYSGTDFTVMATNDQNGYSPNGAVNYLRFYYNNGADYWYADFTTDQLGIPLAPGTYTGATRAAFADPGTPGLDVFGEGRGSNTLTGQFTVTALSVDYSQTVDGGLWHPVTGFAASFVQHSEGTAPALRGSMTFNVAPEPSQTAALGVGLLGLGVLVLKARRRRAVD